MKRFFGLTVAVALSRLTRKESNMVGKCLARFLGVSLLALAIASCGPTVSSNTASSVTEEEVSIDEFLGLLAESDEEVSELGLKKSKSKGNKEEKKKAEKKAREASVPVKNWAQATQQKKQNVSAKREEQRKKNPERAVANKKPENKKKNLAAKVELKEKKLKQKIRAENKKRSPSEKKLRNLKKRKANLGTAMLSFRDVKKLPNKGLPELVAKCKAIAEAKSVLKETNSPKRPFAGNRKAMIQGLEKQRDMALKVNKVANCKAARKLASSVPMPADAADEVDVADEEIKIDGDTENLDIEAADEMDFADVEAELEADLEAEAEMIDAGMDPGLDPVMDPGMDPGMDADAAMAGDASGCVVLQADGTKVYTSTTANEAACKTTCTALEATNPYRSCSFNGTVFREVPLKNCVITAADGSILVNMKSIPSECRKKCSSFAASHPGKSCSWDGNVLTPD
jgi:hypothetical protein